MRRRCGAMEYDVVIIGAGMSGLAAGIRLAYFGKRVCIFERHYAYGGLNSYYRLGGREFDVGLHALTNFVPPGRRNAPLNKLLRQLRIDRDEWDLREQVGSDICFPSRRLRFSNDPALLESQVAQQFPDQADHYRRLVEVVTAHDDATLSPAPMSGRRVLGAHLTDPLLIDMLLCPLMFYGCPTEDDMDFTHLVTLFKSLFLEGFARPREGVRRILKTLVRHYRASGGQMRMRCGVRKLHVEKESGGDTGRIAGVELDTGEIATAPIVLSCAGFAETMRLCEAPFPSRRDADLSNAGLSGRLPRGQSRAHPSSAGQSRARKAAKLVSGIACPTGFDSKAGRNLSFTESICLLDVKPMALGYDRTITFFSTLDRFEYRTPQGLIDPRSGVICCPNNYADHEHLPEGVLRFTSLANYDRWKALAPRTNMGPQPDAYAAAKASTHQEVVEHAMRYLPDFRRHVRFTDTFTPLTIERFTGHDRGAVYGDPVKHRDGRTPIANLFICGTDQGYLGIIGALLSGITVANLHVLGAE
ncbi:MAG: NAD(P)/FAD-dependent oxidoreductase [Phycisphaerales bacterium]|nr:NAD(P)/FAD-dependent oxidoreductase [Phycisphaerales bacterium]